MFLMTNGHQAVNGWRTESMYSFSEAAKLAEVSVTTVKNWLFGYAVRGREIPPMMPSRNTAMVSFLQMIEIMVAGRFRKSASGSKPVPLRVVRDAYSNAQQIFGIEYPFAHMRLASISGHIIHYLESDAPASSFQALDLPEQWTLPGLLKDTIDQIDYDHNLASRWYPIGKKVPIVVDPRVSTGLPVIAGRGVTVQAIRNRFKAGLRIDFIANDFELDRDLVEIALQYWERVAT